jgi:hypothetical protein
MRNRCGTKKIIPKANKIVVITGFSLSTGSPCLKRQALSVTAADPLSGGAAKPTQPIPASGPHARQSRRRRQCSRAGCRRSIPGLGDGGEQSVPAFRPHRQFGAGRIYRDQLRAALWTRRGWQMERCCDASIGPLSTLHPYQEDSHRRVEYRRSTKVDKAQGQAPIPQGAWRSTICEDPPPKNKKQPQRQSPKPRREASARIPPSQESHPIPSLLCLFSSRRD